MLDLAGGIAGQREDDETGQSAHGLPRGDEDLEKAGIHVASLGDAGEMLDEQAKVAYRRRLSELREELEEAKELGNVDRAEQAEAGDRRTDAGNSRAPWDWVDVIGGRRRLRNEPGRASPRRSRRWWKGSRRVMPRWGKSSRDTSGRATSAPISRTPISRLRGNSRPRIRTQPSSQQSSSQAQVAIPLQHVTDHRQAAPVMLDVSPFSLAERTAFVGRETEGSTIRAVIDRARTGHGSVVMLWDGPGVGKTRLAMEMAEYASRMASDAPSGTATKEMSLILTSRSSRSSKVIWRRRRAWMITVDVWGTRG